MTHLQAMNDAYDAFLDALVKGPWRTRPAEAEQAVQRCRAELRQAAEQIDPANWPRHIATLLWRPPDHHEPSPHPPDNVVSLPELEDDG